MHRKAIQLDRDTGDKMIEHVNGAWHQIVRAIQISETATRLSDTTIVHIECCGRDFVARVVTLPSGEKCPAYWNECASDEVVRRSIADLVAST